MDGHHEFAGPYTGHHTDYIAFPMGGLGSGMICLNGQGGFTDVSVRNRPQLHSRPLLFASLRTEDWVRVVEAPVPDHLITTPTDRK